MRLRIDGCILRYPKRFKILYHFVRFTGFLYFANVAKSLSK